MQYCSKVFVISGSVIVCVVLMYVGLSDRFPVWDGVSTRDTVTSLRTDPLDDDTGGGSRGPPSRRQGCSLCPLRPYDAVTETKVAVNYTEPSIEELSQRHPELSPGGRWSPRDCIPRHRLAIIVPYRDRETNLKLFLQHIHPFLQSQLVEYGIYVAEQMNDKQFNRGLCRNVGFVEAMKLDSFDCVIFHDVDLLPIDLRNIYSCSEVPRHFCVAVDYILNYAYLGKMAPFGGVVGMRTEHFRAANGYSNLFYGWGGEDEDLGNSYVQLKAVAMLMPRDGLNSLSHTVLNVTRPPLYTHIQFDFDETKYHRPSKRQRGYAP